MDLCFLHVSCLRRGITFVPALHDEDAAKAKVDVNGDGQVVAGGRSQETKARQVGRMSMSLSCNGAGHRVTGRQLLGRLGQLELPGSTWSLVHVPSIVDELSGTSYGGACHCRNAQLLNCPIACSQSITINWATLR